MTDKKEPKKIVIEREKTEEKTSEKELTSEDLENQAQAILEENIPEKVGELAEGENLVKDIEKTPAEAGKLEAIREQGDKLSDETKKRVEQEIKDKKEFIAAEKNNRIIPSELLQNVELQNQFIEKAKKECCNTIEKLLSDLLSIPGMDNYRNLLEKRLSDSLERLNQFKIRFIQKTNAIERDGDVDWPNSLLTVYVSDKKGINEHYMAMVHELLHTGELGSLLLIEHYNRENVEDSREELLPAAWIENTALNSYIDCSTKQKDTEEIFLNNNILREFGGIENSNDYEQIESFLREKFRLWREFFVESMSVETIDDALKNDKKHPFLKKDDVSLNLDELSEEDWNDWPKVQKYLGKRAYSKIFYQIYESKRHFKKIDPETIKAFNDLEIICKNANFFAGSSKESLSHGKIDDLERFFYQKIVETIDKIGFNNFLFSIGRLNI
jgi:hypothetical protein